MFKNEIPFNDISLESFSIQISYNLYFIKKKHIATFVSRCLFNSFKLASSSSFSFIWILHSLHNFLSLHSLQNLIFVGIIIPLSNDFFQLLGNNADNFLPSINIKFWDRSNNRLLSLNPLSVFCSYIIPYLSIVKQYFILGAEKSP